MLDSSEYQLMKYFPVMLCQNIVSQKQNSMEKNKKFNGIFYISLLLMA